MITCDLIGRMGNQMFQIATTAAHAWRVGKPYAFPDRAQGSYTGETYFHHLPKVNPRRVFPIYKEKTHRYTPIPLGLTDVKLHGYWQSEKYFKDYREKIIDLFNIPIQEDMRHYVAVHVRRGDYLEMAEKHPTVSKKYIQESIDQIGKDFEPLFFSDDIKWCMDNFEGSFYTNIHPIQSIGAMASCSHNIIANSSFSWWGAWLNSNPDKKVIAPKVWFGPGNSHLDPTDIYCENWITL
jgi:hypothetical protein